MTPSTNLERKNHVRSPLSALAHYWFAKGSEFHVKFVSKLYLNSTNAQEVDPTIFQWFIMSRLWRHIFQWERGRMWDQELKKEGEDQQMFSDLTLGTVKVVIPVTLMFGQTRARESVLEYFKYFKFQPLKITQPCSSEILASNRSPKLDRRDWKPFPAVFLVVNG